MDLSIRPVTPEIMRQRGADAFDRGLGIHDHDMNPGSPAIADWMRGWARRQAAVRASRMAELAGVAGAPYDTSKGTQP